MSAMGCLGLGLSAAVAELEVAGAAGAASEKSSVPSESSTMAAEVRWNILE